MNSQLSRYYLVIALLILFSCGEDEDPTVDELLISTPWLVENYEITASSGGIQVSDALLAPYVDAIVDEAPVKGIITFSQNDFSIADDGVTIEGTWSLANDDKDLTMVFPGSGQTFTFEIIKINTGEFNVKYSAPQTIQIAGNAVTVDFEITVFMIPA